MKPFKFLVIFALISFTINAQSQRDSIPTMTFKDEVIVETYRLSSKVPMTSETICQSELKQLPQSAEIPVQIKYTPSIINYSDNGTGLGYSYYRLRGLDQTRVNVTLDGVPLNDAEDQGTYFSNFTDFSGNIESVQIQRGVGLTSNGSSNYAGALNFESYNVFNKISNGGIYYEMGEFNTRKFSINTLFKNDNSGIYTRYSKSKTDGYRDNSGGEFESVFLLYSWLTDNSINKFTFLAGNAVNDMVYLATNESDLKINRKTNYLSPEEKDGFKQRLGSFQNIYLFSSEYSLHSTFFYNTIDGNYDVKIDNSLWNFNLDSEHYGIIENFNSEYENVKITTGFSQIKYQRDHSLFIKPTPENLYFNSGNKNELEYHGKFLLTVSNFDIVGDIQNRFVTFEYTPEKSYQLKSLSRSWEFVNYKYGFNYNISPILTGYVSIGKSYREPTRNDMFAGYDDLDASTLEDIGGNINRIKPESVLDYETGFKFNNLFRYFSGSINLFNMEFSNEITPIGKLSYIGLPLRKNVESSFRRGLELDVEYGFDEHIELKSNYSFIDAEIKQYENDSDSLVYNSVSPLLTPKHIFNQSVKVYLPNEFTLSGSLKYQSESYLDNTENDSRKLPAFYTADVNIQKRFVGNLTLSVYVNNIFDNHYYSSGYFSGSENAYYVNPGRNYSLSLRLELF